MTNLLFFNRLIFVDRFAVQSIFPWHFSILSISLLIEVTIALCVWSGRSSVAGFIIISTRVWFCRFLHSEKSSIIAFFKIEVEAIREGLSVAEDSILELIRCLFARIMLDLLQVLFSTLSSSWFEFAFELLGDNPNVFLRIFFQPCSMTRFLLWDVFMRNARGNKIKYSIILLIITGNVVELKITTTIIPMMTPIISKTEIMKVTWAFTLILFNCNSSFWSCWSKAFSDLGGFCACLKIRF